MLEVIFWILYVFFGLIAFIATAFLIKIKDYGKPVYHQIDPTGIGLFTFLFAALAAFLWPAIPIIIVMYFLNSGTNKIVKTYFEYTNKVKQQND